MFVRTALGWGVAAALCCQTARGQALEDFVNTSALGPAPILQEPQASESAQSEEGERASMRPAQPGETSYELTLEEAVEIALRNDLGLQIEQLAVEVASFDARGSWGAFDPVLAATGSIDDQEFPGQTQLAGAPVVEVDSQQFSSSFDYPLRTGGGLNLSFNRDNTETNNEFQVINPSTSDQITVAYNQPLLRGAWSKYATSTQREAEVRFHQQRELYRQRHQELLLRVSDAYWDLVASRENRDVAQTTLELGQEQLEQNERRLEFGVGTEVDVLQAQATVAQREEELLNAEVLVRETADRLKTVLSPGIDVNLWNVRILPTTGLPESADEMVPAWESILVTALAERPELRQQRLEIDAAELQLERAKSERKVALDLNLSSTSNSFAGDASDAFESAVGWDFPSYRAQLDFSMPIFNRTARYAVRAATARVRSARLTYDQRATDIAAEVRTAVRQLDYSALALKAAETSRELAQRQLDAEQARYREGLSTTFQVLEFQQQLSTALSSETAARVNLAKARAALEKAEGTIGEDE